MTGLDFCYPRFVEDFSFWHGSLSHLLSPRKIKGESIPEHTDKRGLFKDPDISTNLTDLHLGPDWRDPPSFSLPLHVIIMFL